MIMKETSNHANTIAGIINNFYKRYKFTNNFHKLHTSSQFVEGFYNFVAHLHRCFTAHDMTLAETLLMIFCYQSKNSLFFASWKQ